MYYARTGDCIQKKSSRFRVLQITMEQSEIQKKATVSALIDPIEPSFDFI